MIKLKLSDRYKNIYIASEKPEGYFCTVEELRECLLDFLDYCEDGEGKSFDQYSNDIDTELLNPFLNNWLVSKDLNEKAK